MASARQPWLTSLPHERILASTVNADRIAELDGSLDRPTLQALLVAWLREGRLGQSSDTPTTKTASKKPPLRQLARKYASRALTQDRVLTKIARPGSFTAQVATPHDRPIRLNNMATASRALQNAVPR
jgi:hypothetical protein